MYTLCTSYKRHLNAIFGIVVTPAVGVSTCTLFQCNDDLEKCFSQQPKDQVTVMLSPLQGLDPEAKQRRDFPVVPA